MFSTIRKNLVAMASGVPGFHTNRKLILFSSDDWGSIRVDSPKAREKLKNAGINMDSNRFDRFDMLESDTDMEILFEVLLKHKDYKGNHPVITAVTNVTNPDFEKIKSSNFGQYYFQNLVETHAQYPGHSNVYDYYKKGIELGIFLPQSHGREHLHVKRWMGALQAGHKKTCEAFDQKYFMLNSHYLVDTGINGFGAAFELDNITELDAQKGILIDGSRIFENLFNYKATYFTAPAEKYNIKLEETLYEEGIRLIDIPKLRRMPIGNGKTKVKLHYLGQKNNLGQYYLTRNAVFEPNIDDNSDGVDKCLNDISMAFKWNKPAILSNHRAAFVGGIDAANRDKGLRSLDRLLCKITKQWPVAEFLGVTDLHKIFLGHNHEL